jgi:hypothetical protein
MNHILPDLNINIVEVDNGEVQQQNAIEVHHIPDLNINVVEDIDLYIGAGYAEYGSEQEENYEENNVGYAEFGSDQEEKHS